MRNPPRLPRNGLGLLLALLATLTGSAALTPTEWQHRQALKVVAPGLTKISLPAITFDSAQPDLSDLRLIDANGQELPWLLQDFVMSVTQYWRFVMGAVLVLLVVFMPQGLSGTIEALINRRQRGR